MTALALIVAAALSAAAAGGPAPAPAPAAPPQARYDAALALMLEGRLADAALAFDAVASDPAAPAALAERARALAGASRALDARGRFVPKGPAVPPGAEAGAGAGEGAGAGPGAAAPARPRRLDRSGRGELALYSTAYGIWTGVATGVLLEADDPKAYAALALGGGGAGLALAVYGTRGRDFPAGRTQAIEAGGNWGSLNGGLVAGLLDSSTRGTVGATLGGGLAGLAGTLALTGERSPSSGDVALATSGAMWGLAAGGLGLTFLDDPSDEVIMATLLVASDAGLLGMALAARRVDVSRGRSLLIDAGGVVGTLAGLSIPLFLGSEEPAAYGAAGLAGLAGGLTAATLLTRGWDADDRDERGASGPQAMPWVARRDDGFSAGLAGRF